MKQATDLSALRLCEDGFRPIPTTPTTVVCYDLWGNEAYEELVMPITSSQKLRVAEYGLTDQGIAVTFHTQQDAAMFRLFFKGESMAAHG